MPVSTIYQNQFGTDPNDASTVAAAAAQVRLFPTSQFTYFKLRLDVWQLLYHQFRHQCRVSFNINTVTSQWPCRIASIMRHSSSNNNNSNSSHWMLYSHLTDKSMFDWCEMQTHTLCIFVYCRNVFSNKSLFNLEIYEHLRMNSFRGHNLVFAQR